jgi:hypothetical protein
MVPQPARERPRLAVRQQGDRPPPLQVDQHGAVGVALAQGPVVDPEHRGCRHRRQGRRPDQAQQGVAGARDAQLSAQAGAGRPAEREAEGGEPPAEPRRPARPWRRHPGQPLGEDAPGAAGVVAEQAADPEPEHDGVLAPGQVGQGSFVAAVDALGPSLAQRASCRAPPGPEGQGDRGSGGLKRPGFEPDRGRIRQQAREWVHPSDMATPQTQSPKAAMSPHSLRDTRNRGWQARFVSFTSRPTPASVS